MRDLVAMGVLCTGLLAVGPAWAGHHDGPATVRIRNVKATPRDAKTATISFDLTWRNSWRHEVSHDAVWMFFKAKPEGSTEWRHVRLVADHVLNPAGYGQEGGTKLDFIVPDDEGGPVGMFVRRAEYGQGTVTATGITVVVEWKQNVQPSTVAGAVSQVPLNPEPRTLPPELRAFGLEMVYVPEGPFLLGLNATDANAFYQYTDGLNSETPYKVASAGPIPTGRQKGKLWAGGKEGYPEDGGKIPATFPNGYAAFYCMKGQIKFGQYAGFLDTISPELVAKHKKGKLNPSGTPPRFTPAVEGEATDYLYDQAPWPQGAAWGAWAGLRPMTELEFEKVSRGPLDPGVETGYELKYSSYWGMQDCNGWKASCEHTVTVGNAKGRGFKGTHGNGTLVLPADWPQDDGVGSGMRGGYEYRNPACRISAAQMISGGNAIVDGSPYDVWRGVRTAPAEAGK